jgi:hypothetical protein
MNTKIPLLQKVKSLDKRQKMRIAFGIAVLVALILILWPAAG